MLLLSTIPVWQNAHTQRANGRGARSVDGQNELTRARGPASTSRRARCTPPVLQGASFRPAPALSPLRRCLSNLLHPMVVLSLSVHARRRLQVGAHRPASRGERFRFAPARLAEEAAGGDWAAGTHARSGWLPRSRGNECREAAEMTRLAKRRPAAPTSRAPKFDVTFPLHVRYRRSGRSRRMCAASTSWARATVAPRASGST